MLFYGDLTILSEIDIQKCVEKSINIFCNTPKSATYRQHARTHKKKEEDRPNLSYYSRDYNEQPTTELVSQMIKKVCPLRFLLVAGLPCASGRIASSLWFIFTLRLYHEEGFATETNLNIELYNR